MTRQEHALRSDRKRISRALEAYHNALIAQSFIRSLLSIRAQHEAVEAHAHAQRIRSQQQRNIFEMHVARRAEIDATNPDRETGE